MSTTKKDTTQVCVEDFEVKTTIGRGGFAVVYVVREKKSQDVYAMKVQRRSPEASGKVEENLRSFQEERDVLSKAQSPWLTRLYLAFQDEYNFYLVMDYHPGGDLFFLLNRLKIMDEEETRFYTAEIIEAIHAVHRLGYIHRDIKPENILFDRNGHVKLVDFGFSSKMNENGRASTISLPVGTRDYISPELLNMVDSTRDRPAEFGPEVDFWSVGVVLYEMLYGNAPFTDEASSIKTLRNILTFKSCLTFPDDAEVSTDSISLIQELLIDADDRINYEGAIKHAFFKGLQFDNLQQCKPPHIPMLSSQEDTSNFEPIARESIIPSDVKVLGRHSMARSSLGGSFSANKSRDALNTSLEEFEAKLTAHSQLTHSTTDVQLSDLRTRLHSTHTELERERAAREKMDEMHRKQLEDKDTMIKQMDEDLKGFKDYYERTIKFQRAEMDRAMEPMYAKLALLTEHNSDTKQELATANEKLASVVKEKEALKLKLQKQKTELKCDSEVQSLRWENSHLSETVKEKTRLCASQQFEIANLKDTVEELILRIRANDQSSETKEAEDNTEKKKLLVAEENNEQLVAELTRRVAQLAEAANKEASATRLMQKQQADRIEVLCAQLSSMKEERKELEKKCDKYMDDRLDKYDKLKQEQALNKELSQKVDMMTKELAEIRRQGQEQVDSEVKTLRRRSDALKETNMNLDSRLNRINEENKHLASTRDEIEKERKNLNQKLKQDSAEHEATVSRLEEDLRNTKISLAAVEATVQEVQRREEGMKEKLRLLQTEADKYKADRGGDKVLVKELQNRLRHLTISKEQSEQESKELVIKLDRITAQMTKYHQMEGVYTEAEGQLSVCNQEMEKLRTSRDDLAARCRQLEAQLETHRAQEVDWTRERALHKRTCGQLEELLTQQKQDQRARATVVHLESKLQQNNTVHEAEMRSLKQQLVRSENAEKGLTLKIAELKDAKQHTESVTSKLRDSLDKAHHEINALKEECTGHLTSINKLSAANVELNSLLIDVENRYDSLECVRAELIRDLEDDRATHEVHLYRLEETNKQQAKLIDFLRGDSSSQSTSSKTMVGSVLKRNRRPSEGAGILRPSNQPASSTPSHSESGDSIGLSTNVRSVKPQHISWSALKKTPKKH